KENGARVAVVNPFREPGLARYWVPSVAKSALFGTELADEWYDVHTGGDRAFLIGVLRALIEMNGVDEAYVRERTVGFDAVRDEVMRSDRSAIEHESGSPQSRIREFARLLMARPNAVFVWSMGLTQHARGADTVGALINV